MNIKLYQNSSEVNRVTKSDYLTLKYNLDGNLRAECNLLDPVIEIASDTPLLDINYCYIEDFKRYYFVDSVDIVVTGLYRLKLSVDVLCTYSSELRSLNAFVTRNQYNYDKYIIDYKAPISGGLNVYSIANVTTNFDLTYNFYYLIVTLKYGEDPVNGFPIDIDDPYFTETNYCNGSTAPRYKKYVVHNADTSVKEIMTKLTENENLATGVVGIYITPINLTGLTDDMKTSTIELLKESFTISGTVYDITYQRDIVNQLLVQSYLIEETSETGYPFITSFLRDKPYTKYFLKAPFCDVMEFNSSWLWQSMTLQFGGGAMVQIYIDYVTDIINNITNIYITNGKNKCFYKAQIQFFNKLGITTSNIQTLRDEQTKTILNTILTTLTGISLIGAGAATANPMAVIGGSATLLGGTVGAAATLAAEHVSASSVPSVGDLCLIGNTDLRLYCITNKLTDAAYDLYDEEENSYAKLYGYPLNESVELSTLTGYTEIGEIHLENLTATKEEIKRIENILKTGGIIL